MNRKEFIELATKSAEVFGRMHENHILDAQDTIRAIADAIVDALNEGYDIEKQSDTIINVSLEESE
jgi:hypothetical protein